MCAVFGILDYQEMGRISLLSKNTDQTQIVGSK